MTLMEAAATVQRIADSGLDIPTSDYRDLMKVVQYLASLSADEVEDNEEPCTCTYQYPRCPAGIDLERKSMRAHIALQQATPENREALHQAFSEAVSTYMKHVDSKKEARNG